MQIKKIAAFLFLIPLCLTWQNAHAETTNVGIIPSNIWYSKDPFKEGDKIKIYTVVYNSDTREFSGSVIFFDNDVFLGKTDFKIPGKETSDVSVNWTVTTGDHVIFAKIENAKFLLADGNYEETYIADNKTIESKRTVSKEINIADSANSLANSIADSSTVSNIKKNISENTPEFVSDAINSTTGILEEARSKVADFSDTQKESVKKQIENFDKQAVQKDTKKENKTSTDNSKTDSSKLLKPLKYMELFFLSLCSFIFNHKFVYYLCLFVVIFLILRFIWRLIF